MQRTTVKPSTATQRRARRFLADSLTAFGTCVITVEWRKSSTWGRIAVIVNHDGEKMAQASGCGYDKLSACLADFLMMAPQVIDAAGVAGLGGTGYSNLAAELPSLSDLTIERTGETRTSDTFRISVKGQEAGK